MKGNADEWVRQRQEELPTVVDGEAFVVRLKKQNRSGFEDRDSCTQVEEEPDHPRADDLDHPRPEPDPHLRSFPPMSLMHGEV
ncbi:hypothetical protein V6N00_12540 [Tersicoccus sp. MR15.9]|uniref:hypothetical protein n=1 Tax=Tersicoccus mangrovi TaxID=3121635 RepID=UPI002FE5B554